MTSFLKLSGIRKVYPSTTTNDGIDLKVLLGQIHAVLGENGAGGSDHMKAIIYRATAPNDGEWRGAMPAHSLSGNSLFAGFERGLARLGFLKLRGLREVAVQMFDGFDVRRGGAEFKAHILN